MERGSPSWPAHELRRSFERLDPFDQTALDHAWKILGRVIARKSLIAQIHPSEFYVGGWPMAISFYQPAKVVKCLCTL